MAEKTLCIFQKQTKPLKIVKWKVKEGSAVSIGRIILVYEFEEGDDKEQRKLKLYQAGTIHKILQTEGAIVAPGEILCELKECSHPTIMNDMCAECGADLRKDDITCTASVPMVHAIPELKVSEEVAQKIGKADTDRLIKDRKLVLLVDLDQTLIHTTNDNIPPNIKDVYHFQLYGPNSPWYHTRLRPGTHQFLNNIYPYFELHICTFGARNYAHTIAAFLDIEQKYFSNRILSRDECFDPTSKKANLKALFPCGDNMVCIIDDREDVWSHASNLIHVKPYHFFQHTGDINAPPGLDKQENDEKAGVDLSKVNPKNNEITNHKNDSEIKATEIIKDEEEEKSEGEIDDTDECDIDEEKPNSSLIKEETKLNGNKIINKNNELNNLKNEEILIEIDDKDDYLFYLEDILKRIHAAFYENFDKLESGEVPDLKKVIPHVRSEVLKGCKLVFSGLVPTHVKLQRSKAYQIAKSLGAEIGQDIDSTSTHLVAVRPGTAKVNAGRRKKNLKIVTPDWLWCCAERWEHVDENIFPLNSKGSKNRHPPPHCSSPEHLTYYPEHSTPAIRKRTPSGRFMDTINPLMSFSSDDIADMDKEVEDILDDESDTTEDEEQIKMKTNNIKRKIQTTINDDVSSSSDDDIKNSKRIKVDDVTDTNNTTTEDDADTPSVKFRHGEPIDSEVDIEKNVSDDSEGSIDPPDESDDCEWNMMGAALEREFLSNN